MRTVIVTGASAGIGRACAEAFAGAGWTVGLIARRAGVLADMAGDRMIPLPCDVTDAAAVEAAFERFAQRAGRLDVLFNNAGVFPKAGPIDEISVAEWQAGVDVNLTGMFLCARAAFGAMRRQAPPGGRIINNGSISAQSPRAGAAVYTVTKHGLTGLTKQIALDGRAYDIACGQIDIGNAHTELLEGISRAAEARGDPPPPSFDVGHVARAVLQMADLPPEANVLFQTIMASKMPFVGRG